MASACRSCLAHAGSCRAQSHDGPRPAQIRRHGRRVPVGAAGRWWSGASDSRERRVHARSGVLAGRPQAGVHRQRERQARAARLRLRHAQDQLAVSGRRRVVAALSELESGRKADRLSAHSRHLRSLSHRCRERCRRDDTRGGAGCWRVDRAAALLVRRCERVLHEPRREVGGAVSRRASAGRSPGAPAAAGGHQSHQACPRRTRLA